MRVGDVRVADVGYRDRVVLVCHVGKAERRLVCTDTDLFALVIFVGSVVRNALRVVSVPGTAPAGYAVGKTSGKSGCTWLAKIDHMEPASTGLTASARADDVGEAGLLVDNDIVSAGHVVVVECFSKRHRLRSDVSELSEVENLHAVITGSVGDDICVVPIHLDIAPHARGRFFRLRQIAEVTGMESVGHIDKRCSVVSSDQGILSSRLGIGPPPDIIEASAASTADIRNGQEGYQIDILATPTGSDTLLVTVDPVTGYRFQTLDWGLEQIRCNPFAAPALPLVNQCNARAVVAPGNAYRCQVSSNCYRAAKGPRTSDSIRRDFFHAAPAIVATCESVDGPGDSTGAWGTDPYPVFRRGEGTPEADRPLAVKRYQWIHLGPLTFIFAVLEHRHGARPVVMSRHSHIRTVT